MNCMPLLIIRMNKSYSEDDTVSILLKYGTKLCIYSSFLMAYAFVIYRSYKWKYFTFLMKNRKKFYFLSKI